MSDVNTTLAGTGHARVQCTANRCPAIKSPPMAACLFSVPLRLSAAHIYVNIFLCELDEFRRFASLFRENRYRENASDV